MVFINSHFRLSVAITFVSYKREEKSRENRILRARCIARRVYASVADLKKDLTWPDLTRSIAERCDRVVIPHHSAVDRVANIKSYAYSAMTRGIVIVVYTGLSPSRRC